MFSVRLDQEILDQIESLVASKEIESKSDFVERCIENGLRFTSYMSRKGVWYLRGVRVGGVSKAAFDIICDNLKNQYGTGKEIGIIYNEFGKFSLGTNPSKKQNWSRALEGLGLLSGWGDFFLKDKIISVVSPIGPPQFLRGCLEGLLGVKTRKVSDEPLRYQIL